ncbi:hypothetical protein PVV74_11600 [Roseovarius sp. SK2]|uniref:hypothetical protein n=1 Tax=Roseovarius TaxID=74030 RepID=UPI00237A2C3D|nr:hypothetical protein [Roseovarius sp. SK2]MDD9726101.1 hypothetical protein [Roseovarius sp. SK2]
MTEAEKFAAEYLRRERAAHSTKQGADCKAILADLAQEWEWDYEDARAAVLDHTVILGAG